MDVLHLIISQVTVDLFLLDWERPHPSNAVGGSSSGTSGGSSNATGSNKDRTVSVWRTYLVANEWNELQTLRKISVPLQIILVVLILRVSGN